MKFLVLLSLVGACVAAEDQKAEDATLVTTYADHPYTYGAYPYSAFGAYSYPSVYSAYGAAPVAYSGLYHSYTPLVHSLKKRDTEAAEDQEADGTTLISTYAAHPFIYNTPYTYAAPYAYSGLYHFFTPLVHSLKKRDTEAAEDQEADGTTLILTYAAHPYIYNTPYTYAAPYAYSGLYHFFTPLVYSLKKRDTDDDARRQKPSRGPRIPQPVSFPLKSHTKHDKRTLSESFL